MSSRKNRYRYRMRYREKYREKYKYRARAGSAGEVSALSCGELSYGGSGYEPGIGVSVAAVLQGSTAV
jgi:hypothetical protein